MPRNPCRAVSGKNRAEKTMSCRASEGRAQKIVRNLDRRPTNGDGVNGDKVMVSRVAPLAPQRPARYPEAHQVQHKQQPYWRREAPPRHRQRQGLACVGSGGPLGFQPTLYPIPLLRVSYSRGFQPPFYPTPSYESPNIDRADHFPRTHLKLSILLYGWSQRSLAR